MDDTQIYFEMADRMAWCDSSVRKILSCLSSTNQYFPYVYTPWPDNWMSPSIENMDMRHEFYTAMSKTAAGAALLGNFERLWESINGRAHYGRMIPTTPGNMQAFIAHVFVLLSFMTDPCTYWWDGANFVKWEGALKLVPNIREMHLEAETWLFEICGREPEDHAWIKERGRWEPTDKPCRSLTIEEAADMAKRLKAKGKPAIQEWHSRVCVWLKAIEKSIYETPVLDIEALFGKHKGTVVELT